jgi:hypothetical protein
MDTGRQPPRLGENFGVGRCTRAVEGGLCGKPGAWHIIWEGLFTSTACAECGEFCRANREYVQMHQLTPGCQDPTSLWFEEQGVCRRPATLEEVAAGRILLDI